MHRGAKTRMTRIEEAVQGKEVVSYWLLAWDLTDTYQECCSYKRHATTFLIAASKDTKYLPSEDMSSSIISPLIFPVKTGACIYGSQQILRITTLNCKVQYGSCTLGAVEIVCHVYVKYLCIPQFFLINISCSPHAVQLIPYSLKAT